jgi:hypothetical protein
MSTNHESQSFYAEYEKDLKHAARLDKVYLMTYSVGGGVIAGTFIGFVLDMAQGTIGVAGLGTIVGGILGGLTGVILLLVNRRRPDTEWSATAQSSDAEPPESVSESG